MNYVLADITRRKIGLYYYQENGNRVFESFNDPIPLAIAFTNGRFEIGQTAVNAARNGVQEAYTDLFDLQGQNVKCNDIESKQFIPEIVRILLEDLFDQKYYAKFRNMVDQVSLLLLFGNDVDAEGRKMVYEGLTIDGFAELRTLVQAVEAVKYFQSSPRYNWSRETDAMVVLSDNVDLSIKCFSLSDYHLTFERRYKGRGRDPRFEWATRKLWKDVQSYTYCNEKECIPVIEKALGDFLNSKRSELNSIRLPDGNDYTVFLTRTSYNVYSPPDANVFASLISDVVREVGLKYETTGIVLQGYAAENKFFRESFNQFDPVSDETEEFRGSIRNFVLKQLLGGVPIVNTEEGSGIGVRGVVTSDGGSKVTERGICWSGSHRDPTINDSHIQSDTEGDAFSMNLMGLSPGKTYYVRAYAVNSVGVGYGNEVEITLSLGGETPPEIIREPEKPEVKTEVEDTDPRRKFIMNYALGKEGKAQTLTVTVEMDGGKALPFDCVFTIANKKLLKLKREESFCEECDRSAGTVLEFGPYTLPIAELGASRELYAQIWPAAKDKSVNLFKNNSLKIQL